MQDKRSFLLPCLERILKINFSGTDELGDKTNYSLIIEIMGKYSNIIFVGKDGKIIDSMKRVDENKSHIREVLPGVTYVAPPKQDKLNIFTDDIEKIREKIAQSRKGMYKAVMEAIKGVSPIICREFEYGLTLDEFKKQAQNPTPTVVFTDAPKDFAFIDIKQYDNLATINHYDTFSQLLDYFYYERVRLMRILRRSKHYIGRNTKNFIIVIIIFQIVIRHTFFKAIHISRNQIAEKLISFLILAILKLLRSVNRFSYCSFLQSCNGFKQVCTPCLIRINLTRS